MFLASGKEFSGLLIECTGKRHGQQKDGGYQGKEEICPGCFKKCPLDPIFNNPDGNGYRDPQTCPSFSAEKAPKEHASHNNPARSRYRQIQWAETRAEFV